MSIGKQNFNIEMEKFVLGSMLLKDGEVIPTVSSILTADDFYRPEHRIIFKAILKLFDNHAPANIMTLIEELRTQNQLGEGKVEFEYVYSLTEIAHTTAYSKYYAYTVKDYSARRNLVDDMQIIAQRINQDIAAPIEDLQADIVNLAFKITAQNKVQSVSLTQYLAEGFIPDIEKMRAQALRSTGFSNLDDKQNFLPGVYVIGAEPALGKTTFAWQLAEQLAERGNPCIFCSYEMSKLEMVSKSIARHAFQDDPNFNLSATDIRSGSFLFSEAAKIQRVKIVTDSVFDNLQVLELSDNFSLDNLLAYIFPLTKSDKPPIVFIDYLQLAVQAGNTDSKSDLKSLIDSALRKLKVFQRDTGVTFILISSFNRTNYNQNAGYESFKESGGIEYSADVIWALQLYAVQELKDAAGVQKIREVINEAKKQFPRQMVLNCLKNRFGNNYNCYFEYFSKFDCFNPCSKDDFTESDSKQPTEDNSLDAQDD